MEIGQNFTKWCKTLNSKANVNIFGEFRECTRGIGYFISSKVPFLNAQSWALLVISGITQFPLLLLPKKILNISI